MSRNVRRQLSDKKKKRISTDHKSLNSFSTTTKHQTKTGGNNNRESATFAFFFSIGHTIQHSVSFFIGHFISYARIFHVTIGLLYFAISSIVKRRTQRNWMENAVNETKQIQNKNGSDGNLALPPGRTDTRKNIECHREQNPWHIAVGTNVFSLWWKMTAKIAANVKWKKCGTDYERCEFIPFWVVCSLHASTPYPMMKWNSRELYTRHAEATMLSLSLWICIDAHYLIYFVWIFFDFIFVKKLNAVRRTLLIVDTHHTHWNVWILRYD